MLNLPTFCMTAHYDYRVKEPGQEPESANVTAGIKANYVTIVKTIIMRWRKTTHTLFV